MKGKKQHFRERFWAMVSLPFGTTDEDCWLWLGSPDKKGYGEIGINYKVHRAHRVSWELNRGPIPSGLLVLHHCDNPLCVNPSHLFLGTHQDNTSDMVNKGRHGNTIKTHCIHGHRFTLENTYFPPRGGRECRACKSHRETTRKRFK